MAARLLKKLARVSRMDWAEVRVRLGQALHKRGDWLIYRMGIRTGMRSGSIRPRRRSSARPGQFFFSEREIAERTELLRTNLPAEAAGILREADEICAHNFRLLGYDNLDYGSQIDWHLDVVHGKRAPRDLWFKIPFLDFAVVGDHKVTWELNRHQHLVTLAKAWRLSGDEKYVRELMAQWRSWIKANPYPLGVNWASTLEVAFRTLSWIWMDHLLGGATDSTEFRADFISEFRAEMLPALAFHGRHIERYLSTYFSPNTHLLGEAVALFFLGTLYAQIPAAERWKQDGWRIVLREARRQVRPDGVYFEQSLHYHVYALDFFLYARLLAGRNEIEVPPAFDDVLRRMLDVVAALAQAGPAEGFGDDDGGRLWNPRRNRTEQMTDPLALGAVMYSHDFSAARLTEEAIWMFGNQAVEELMRTKTITGERSVAFSDGGIYVLADSQPYPQVMAVDAGPQGVGRSGHGHADALSLRLTMDGKRWLVDAGTDLYVARNPADRNRFRGTGAHNTLLVDEAGQAVADEPFSWTHIPTTKADNWIAGKSFTYFAGSHNGYTRLAYPVLHQRQVLKIAGGPWLVRDVALGRTEHELETRWHFAPDLEVRNAGPGRVDITRPGAGESWLSLLVPEKASWTTEITRTLLSPAYGALQSAPLVRSYACALLPEELVTALVPRSGAIRQSDGRLADLTVRRSREGDPNGATHAEVHVYQLDYDEESHRIFLAAGDQGWSYGSWSSDAQVLYCCLTKETLVHLVMIGGSSVAWQGQSLLKMASPATFFEWRRKDALIMNAPPEKFTTTTLFEELTGDSRSLASDWDHSSSSSKQASPSQGSSPYAEKH